MEARPPALIESIVAALIPPASRESVMGDLLERYRSPWAFVAEAARTIPFVLWSRIQRTSNFMFMPIVAVFMMSSFGVGMGGGTTRRGLAPTVAALLAYMLRDAYRSAAGPPTWRQGVVDLLVVASFVAASQALVVFVDPTSLMTPGGVGIGSALLLALYALRMQGSGIRPPAVYPEAMTLPELHQEITVYETTIGRSARIEVVVALLLVPFFVATAALATGPLTRAGAAATVAGLLFVVWHFRYTANPPVPRHLDFRLTVALYRDRLTSQDSRLRTLAFWYLAPLFVGPTLIALDGAAASGRMWQSAAGVLLVQALVLAAVTASGFYWSRSLRRRIAALDEVTERAQDAV